MQLAADPDTPAVAIDLDKLEKNIAPAQRLGSGRVMSIVPNHCCVVSNMVDEVYGLRNGAVEMVWPVAARGKVR